MSEFVEEGTTTDSNSNEELEKVQVTFTAHVVSCEKVNSKDGRFVAYNIEVKSTEGEQWTIQKRYSEFRGLYRAIKAKHDFEAIQKFEFPKKDMFFSEAPDVMEKRRQAFDELCQILLSLNLENPVEVAEFLSMPVPQEEAKENGEAPANKSDKTELKMWLGERSQELFGSNPPKKGGSNSRLKEPTDEQIADFIAVTGADPSVAANLLQVHAGNMEAALAAFTESGGTLIGGTDQTPPVAEPPKKESSTDQKTNAPKASPKVQSPSTAEDASEATTEKTAADRERALALLRVSGLQPGDVTVVDEESIPGLQMFQVSKMILSGNEEETPEESLWSLILTSDRLLLVEPNWLTDVPANASPTATVHSNDHLSQIHRVQINEKDPEAVKLFFQHGTIDESGFSCSSQVFWIPGREAFMQSLSKCLEQFDIQIDMGQSMGKKRGSSAGVIKGMFKNIQKDMQKVHKDVQSNMQKVQKDVQNNLSKYKKI